MPPFSQRQTTIRKRVTPTNFRFWEMSTAKLVFVQLTLIRWGRRYAQLKQLQRVCGGAIRIDVIRPKQGSAHLPSH